MQKAEAWLEKTLDYRFKRAELFERALTHRSAPGRSNERLEFLGDAVLDFVVSDVLFRAFPNAAEGDLSRLRSHLVKDSSLAKMAKELGLGEHLALGSGEKKSGGHRRESILADALEALFGAVYLDDGFDAVNGLIHRAYGPRFVEFPEFDELRDPKTRLQEWLQARGLGLPTYELTETTGKAHNQRFVVRAFVQDDEADGEGTSRRNAEQQAAERLLVRLKEREAAS